MMRRPAKPLRSVVRFMVWRERVAPDCEAWCCYGEVVRSGRLYAGGTMLLAKALRDEAIAIYRKHIREWINEGNPRCPYMGFMSEIDNPCPDLGLRAHYRAAIIEDGLDRR